MSSTATRNTQTVRSYFEAFDRGDFDAAAGFLDPDVAWDWDEGMLIDEDPIRGREAVKAYWERVFRTFRFAHEDLRFLAAGDKVCVLADIRGRGAGSGAELSQPCGYALTLRDGLVVSSLFFGDQDRARRAVGVDG